MVRPVLWSYSPLGGLVTRRLRPRARVYDVVDDYAALGHYRRLLGDDVEWLDGEATAAADLVFVTSPRLGRQRRLLNERCVEVGNAADIDLFARARRNLSRPPDLAAATEPIVCFHGTLGDQKLDAGLLARIALRRPGWTFAVLGHEPDGGARAQLAGVANVRLLGLKPQQEVPAYLAAADAAIVPYRVNDYTLGIDALKAYECLAAGVPVVATDLPCFAGFAPQVRTCRTDAEFDLALTETIATPPPPLPLERLETYTWSAKAARQLAEVQNLVAEVAS
jgi:glycosyltransferase involved in cell wall biosynthesis